MVPFNFRRIGVEREEKRLYTWDMSQRLRPLFFSFLFLLTSLGAYQIGSIYLSPAPQVVAQVSCDTPAGTWQQYVIHEGKPVYLATFTFHEENGDYQVQADDVAPVTFPQSDFKTFAHQFDGNRWNFHSDWHEYGVAWFELKKAGEGRFEGFAYLDGERCPNRHILVRVTE